MASPGALLGTPLSLGLLDKGRSPPRGSAASSPAYLPTGMQPHQPGLFANLAASHSLFAPEARMRDLDPEKKKDLRSLPLPTR